VPGTGSDTGISTDKPDQWGPLVAGPDGPGAAGARVRASFQVVLNALSRGPSMPRYGPSMCGVSGPTHASRRGPPAGASLTSPWPAERLCAARAPDARRTTWMTVDALSVIEHGADNVRAQ